MLSRVDSIISKLGGAERWSRTRDLIWIQQRMTARQQIESLGSELEFSFDGYKTVIAEDESPIADGTMNYAAISELGKPLKN